MMNHLFVSYGETVPSAMIRRPRNGAIISAGQVGMACAYSMLIQMFIMLPQSWLGNSFAHDAVSPRKPILCTSRGYWPIPIV
jgi:hypothetical protein